MNRSWILLVVVVAALGHLSMALRVEDIPSTGEDDGTMEPLVSPSHGIYQLTAPNHDSYLRFTFPTGCHDLKPFTALRMTVWAQPDQDFTIDLRQGFSDCRLDLNPYVTATGSAQASYYTQKQVFDGTGQTIYIPLSHFDVDLGNLAQLFISGIYSQPVKPVNTVQVGNIEFTTDPAPFPSPPMVRQNPTAYSCVEPYTMAVTFDNQKSGNLNKILDDLKALNAKCTVFQIGGDLSENDVAMKRLMAEGHQVAAHTFTHPDLLELPESVIRTEMELTDKALKERLGVTTRWFRPPFGHQDPRVRQILHDMGYVSIIWDIDSTDYFNQDNGPLIWSRIQARIDKMDPARAGGVLLLHNDIVASANLVATSINYAMTKGFRRFVTVEECMQGRYDWFLNGGNNTNTSPGSITTSSPGGQQTQLLTTSPVNKDGAKQSSKAQPVVIAVGVAILSSVLTVFFITIS